MTTVSIIQEDVTTDTAQTSTTILGRLRDWMINALDVHFGLVGREGQANHAADNYGISNPCCCG